ncbi:MAG: hypothetical protein ABI690_13550 [Chloroflexota bacterium]
MARASIETLLPLDYFARIMGISPWDFNQCKYPNRKSAQCNDVLFQFPYQKDRLSREEVAQSIADAEQMIADELGYWPAPKYFTNEEVQYPHAWRPATGHSTPKIVKLKHGHVITGGVFKRIQIGTISGVNLTTADTDNDAVNDTFTAIINDPAIGDISDSNEIALYFVDADRVGEPLDETWRLRPLKISISGTTATIKGHLTLLIKPILESGVKVEALDASVDANYVTSVLCCQVYTDSTYSSTDSLQGEAVWNNTPGCTGPRCGNTKRPLCIENRDYRVGKIDLSFPHMCPARKPDRVEVNYLAGLVLDENGQMQPEMARCVAYLAVSLLKHEKCGCDETNKIFDMWRKRITSFEGGDKTQGYSKSFDDIPFPATEGGVFAWKRVIRWRNSKSVAGLPA